MSSQPKRRIEIAEVGDVTVVRWDDQPHWPLGDQLATLGADAGRRKLVRNFANVDSLSSIVLAKLMTLNKKLQALGGRLTLCNVSPQVRQVFEITRVSEFFGLYPGEQDALQALGD